MERIDFRIEFLEIAFKMKSKRPFSVRLMAKSAEGQELRSEEVVIAPQDGPTSLTEITPFEFFLVAQDRYCYSPLELLFVVNKIPSIRRRVPLHLLSIYDHQMQNEKAFLERIYAFEDGNILYNVKTTESPKIIDPVEAYKYQERLGCGSVSNSVVKEPMAQRAFRTKSRPSFSISDVSDKMSAQETLTLEGDCEEREEGLGQIESWNIFREMENEYIKKKPVESKIKMKKIGNALKLIAALIFIGIFLLVVSSTKERNNKLKQKKQQKKEYKRVMNKKRKDKQRQNI